MKVIDGIYIIREGACLYSRELDDPDEETHLVAGFLTALNHFANRMGEGRNIEQIVVGDSTLSFKIAKKLIFVFKHENAPPSILNDISDRVINEFLELYGEDLEDWNGNVGIFKKFHGCVDEILSKKYNLGKIEPSASEIEPVHVDDEGEILCGVCMMEIEGGIEDLRFCPNGHPVHEECLQEWMKHSEKCPSCGKKYSEDPNFLQSAQ